jgi:aminotransferase
MSAPTISQYAALEALRIGEPYVQEMLAEYDRRRQLVCRRFNEMGLKTSVPHGAFYVFPDVRVSGMDDEEFAEKLLHEERVAVVPGRSFGDAGIGFVRCSYATDYHSLEIALDRIEAFLKRHAG